MSPSGGGWGRLFSLWLSFSYLLVILWLSFQSQQQISFYRHLEERKVSTASQPVLFYIYMCDVSLMNFVFQIVQHDDIFIVQAGSLEKDPA